MKSHIIKLVILLLFLPFLVLQSQNNETEILKAYEQRMDGYTQEAKTMLTIILQRDVTNAMAHFEMARTMKGEKKNHHIGKAIEYDPENTMYLFYQANMQMLEAYKGMKTNNKEQINKYLDECTSTLKRILEINPSCKESLLFLVDIYGALPNEMGGNTEKAELYLKRLKNVDPLYTSQGEFILKSKEKDVDIVKHWETHIKTYGNTDEALIKLGKAFLTTNQIDKAQECFNDVIKRDSEQTILYLDVARAHLYRAMGGGDNQVEILNEFKKNINLYLSTTAKKPKLIEAWCYGWLGMVESRHGSKKLADKHLAKAESIMPNYPRFTAIPKIDHPPNVMVYQYSSYFSPF